MFPGQGEDRAFYSDFTGAGVQNHGDLPVQVCIHMRRCGRAGSAGRVRGGRRKRKTCGPDDGPCDRMRRTTDGNCIQTAGYLLRNGGRGWQYDGKRTRPELLRKDAADIRHLTNKRRKLRRIRNMYNEWIIGRTALCRIDTRGGRGIQRVCRKAVHRLRRDSDKTSLPEYCRGSRDICL